ncbi:PEGA domain-containing protein [Vitiosangium sp. GDMCC 1.1324]|uniref:PEGA domain-containing protein n=1 Tax=Vitiosangium sp. (strain GDMCC 1.1324) TaxID=2138576 RepID=UPI000D3DB56C|nr:PEGA domain-containing protein [Vitiosangium sp. GDMCC 1.1324]PTL84979.1 PEGA domain-containing protein [Vitiosangium sp. GDMCC 1.1324]
MKQKTWIVVILLGTVAINAVAYMVIRGRRTPASVEAPPLAANSASATPVPVAPPQPAAPTPTPAEEAAKAAAAEEANAGLARARRAAGLAALEDRDYSKAVAEFTEALSLRKDKGDLVELLRIASDLQTREHSKPRDEPAKPQPEPTPAAKPAAKAKPVRVAMRTRATKEEPPEAAETTRNGLLLVTSTPPGLVVLVDGKTMDLTPARLTVRAGTHRVALAQGDKRLFEDTVEVAEDAVRSINRDLTAELAPPSAPPPAPTRSAPEPTTAAPAVAAPAQASPSPAATTTAAPEPRAESPAPVAARPAAATGKGDLDVSSPSIYGEVWINNRPYGFPPVTARDIPAGQARVEIRVNGEVKRRMTVEVEPGRRASVRVR